MGANIFNTPERAPRTPAWEIREIIKDLPVTTGNPVSDPTPANHVTFPTWHPTWLAKKMPKLCPSPSSLVSYLRELVEVPVRSFFPMISGGNFIRLKLSQRLQEKFSMLKS
ncbi:hypothetical protein SAY87_018489 [Trapa incisa]|uniref:Uncharacterized protein n=1 Tax=Trapa incisa TaxID=236973 RepID=A0AAN7L2K9_9MYRT|nr:hypothetical protein SAY87_018489 [Trapa incisa]